MYGLVMQLKDWSLEPEARSEMDYMPAQMAATVACKTQEGCLLKQPDASVAAWLHYRARQQHGEATRTVPINRCL